MSVNLRQSASINMGSFRDIPNELTVLVFAYLDLRALLLVSRTCKQWNRISEDDSLWKPLYMSRFEMGNNFRNLSTFEMTEENWRSWKNKYLTKCLWKNGHVIGKYVLRPHEDTIYCLQYDNEKYVTGGADDVVRYTNVSDGKTFKVLKGHQSSVTCLQFDDEKLVTGSKDTTMRVWDVKSGECKQVLKGHGGWISSLQFNGDKLISRSWDMKAKVWDLNTGECINTFMGDSICYSFQFRGSVMVCGYSSHSVKIWDMRTGKRHRALYVSGAGPVRSLYFHGKTLVTGSNDGSVQLWDLQAGRSITKFPIGHQGWVNKVSFSDNRILSGGNDKLVKVWDRQSKNLRYELEGPKEAVMDLQFDQKKVVAASKDGSLTIWNFSEQMPGYPVLK